MPRTLSRRSLVGAALTLAATAVAPAASAAGRRHPDEDTPIRHIPLQGAVNVRDVGGYRAHRDRTVRHGLVYRSDALSKLTDADVTTLAGLGLRQVVDYRVPVELQYDGQDRLPAGLTAISRPVADNGLYAQMMAAIGSKDPAKQEELLGGGRAAAFMRSVYTQFVSDADNRTRFADTLRDTAYGPGARGALLYHCTSGKDRTGWTTYVLLRLLGVGEQSAVADYLASNTFRAAYDATVRDRLKQSGMMVNPDLLIPLQEVRTEYLSTALDQVRTDYGSLGRYVSEGLGLDRHTLGALRDRLLD
ncbi:tyrosine-protein phosphatase [Streptomyces antnestii]|uniref:Tyrosine-protein phosphatase n=1 Tax=Streptomyces antnestii TaxID=2494256 RepID=A0A437PIZ5_9ACTN|nr:tyrosine-protein phosphatase [Streptomyces sp. San01]RVU22187.1 tyrosine-protein phosphatase [Streptomyces sp. San01]